MNSDSQKASLLEEALVDAFIVPRKRGQYRTLLANGKRRAKILNDLNHLQDLDPGNR